jgi:hypothetical protein
MQNCNIEGKSVSQNGRQINPFGVDDTVFGLTGSETAASELRLLHVQPKPSVQAVQVYREGSVSASVSRLQRILIQLLS